jgi:hypothetical protein
MQKRSKRGRYGWHMMLDGCYKFVLLFGCLIQTRKFYMNLMSKLKYYISSFIFYR